MMIHDVTDRVGRYRARKRIGRGRSSGRGKTSGRGHKGAGSRAGYTRQAYFEGGQMSFARRLPKRGFSNAAFRRPFHIVNLKVLETRFQAGAEVNARTLAEAGLIRDTARPVKILGEGELTRTLVVTANRFSTSARAKIEAAGGTVHEITRRRWTRRRGAGPKSQKATKGQGR